MSFSIKPEERERETDTMGGPPSAGVEYPLTYHLGRQTAPSALDAPRQHHSNSAPASVNGAMDAPEQDDPGTVSASANEAFSSGRQATSSATDAPEQDHPGPTSIPANESSKDKHTATRPVLRERTQEAMHQLNVAAVHKKGGANSAYERFHDVCRKHDELAFRFTSEQMRLTDAKMRFDAVRRWRRTGQSPVPSRMARWELELQYAAEKHRKVCFQRLWGCDGWLADCRVVARDS